MAAKNVIEVSPSGTSQKQSSYIDFISTQTSDITVALILILLFLGTLRSAIAYLGLTRRTRFERFFYDQTHEELASIAVGKSLEELGITPSSRSTMKLLCPQIIRNVRVLDETQNLKKLLVLLAVNSHSCLSIYGKDTPVHTSVIINTMEASLLDENCELMAELLLAIYTRKLLSHGQIDFVVVPKAGNPLLAKKLADMLNAICLVCKSGKDSSRIMPENHSSNTNTNVSLNVEGFTFLKRKADASNHQLNGILIDCNCSGGNGLIHTANEFNRIVRATGANVGPLRNGMVLFRVDLNLSPSQFNSKFQAAETPLSISRYIDLDEPLKKALLELGEEIIANNHEVHKEKVQDKIAKICSYARDNNLIILE
jgi:hypothetical protein